MIGDRYRLVHCQYGKEHVESVVYGETEIAEQLQYEREMHVAAGWVVKDVDVDGVPHLMCFSPRGRVRRIYAKRFRALTDAVRVDESPPPPRTAHTGEDA